MAPAVAMPIERNQLTGLDRSQPKSECRAAADESADDPSRI